MSSFEKAWAIITKQDDDLIIKFRGPYDDFPSLPLGSFLDFYPELMTENVEDILSLMPLDDRLYSRAMFRLPPHHQMQDELDSENFELLRPSGWTYDGYAEPALLNMVRGTKDNIIDPPPLDEVLYWGFQTGLGQGGASGIWNRLNYHNQLSPIQYQNQYKPSFGIEWKPGDVTFSRPGPTYFKDGVKLDEPDFSEQKRWDDNMESIARQVFPKDHYAHHMKELLATDPEVAASWNVRPTTNERGVRRQTYYRENEPEWAKAMQEVKRGQRYVETPAYSPIGERISLEGNQFNNAQELIAYLLSTDGKEEWSEKKREEEGQKSGLGSVSRGHDTRQLRRNIKDITDRQRDLM